MHVPGLSKPKVDHFIFPWTNRSPRAVGDAQSHDMRIRVPTDDEKTTTFWLNAYPSITDQGRLKTEGLKEESAAFTIRVPRRLVGPSRRTTKTPRRRKARASSPTARSRRWAGATAASRSSARCCMTGSTRSSPQGFARRAARGSQHHRSRCQHGCARALDTGLTRGEFARRKSRVSQRRRRRGTASISGRACSLPR